MKHTFKLLLTFSAILANSIYILWRVFFTFPTGANSVSLFFAIGLLCAELLGIFEFFVYLHGASASTLPAPLPAKDVDFPDIDIFIATYNEPVALLRKTIVGCKRMHYPAGKSVTIFLCDDGNRAEMKDLADEFHIEYLNRSDNHGAKAGNLNNALNHSHAPLIATFDADMIPMEGFLMETVPYFLNTQDKIGFVQTPQSFYNPDLFQAKLYATTRVPNEQDYFYRNVQLTKNRTNTVIYGGSNTVISRAALEEVGGFYEDSITEDFATGILIQSKNYKCCATDKPLASGLSPHDLKSLLKQRERWARGCIQTIKKLNIFTRKELTFAQKISYTSAISYWFAPLKHFFYIMSPIAFTVFGIRVIHATLAEILLFCIPAYTLTNLAIKGYCNNIRNARWTNIYETITFPTLIRCVILETLGISEEGFSVTSKNRNDGIEKEYHYKRATPFYIYIMLSLIGIANVLIYMPQYTTWNFIVLLFWLITNLLYLILALLFILEFNQSNTHISYDASLKFQLANEKETIHTSTTRITDTGFTFELHDCHPLPIDSIFHVRFPIQNTATDSDIHSDCEFQIKIKDIKHHKHKRAYHCEILAITTEQQDLWHYLLHNRPPSMPEVIVDSKNIFHDLAVNILARSK